jgi:branched-chain amino acid transport system substrate-binding protein
MSITSRCTTLFILCASLFIWTACGTDNTSATITIATLFPQSGADAALGAALQRGVDLAIQQHANLPHGYNLKVLHVDSAAANLSLSSLTDNVSVFGIVGPYESSTAIDLLPLTSKNKLAVVSPTNTLPGLTHADLASSEGVSFTSIHPSNRPLAYFRLALDDQSEGKTAADVAIQGTDAHGLAAQSAFIVDDGTLSSKARATAFTQEFKAKQGTVAGQATFNMKDPQMTVKSIIGAQPDIVYYTGGIADGAALRSALSLTGVPRLPILAGSQLADYPDWATAVGQPAATANTLALVSAPDPASLTDSAAKQFVSDYGSAYSNAPLIPQTLLAYDAAMVEITAIQGILAKKDTIARADVVSALASTDYVGVTGHIGFTPDGDRTPSPGFSLYTCAANGAWSYSTHVNG